MRLLDTETLQLRTFVGDSVPKYAILSHTWEDEEVTFEDMKPGGDAINMKGYAKIEASAKLARSEGIDYIWIDTCCIDKSSSAELSEAINSMFSWYQRAEICYAYLFDVKGGAHPGPPIGERLEMFRKSKWYTRGWTLQELLAPPKLVFYDCQWGRIDDRRELRELIRKITGIRARIVCGHLSHTSVSAAEKMSWAAHRQTTRAEDIAYCLLGLFDVNMPLLYGEGPIKAFLRLQHEFLRGSEDESIFAWWVPEAVLGQDDYKPNFCGLLATSPRHFSSSGRIRITTHRRFLPENRPTEITNRGIRLQLPLYPVPNDPSDSSYFALLHCHRQESENYDTDSHHIVIILQRLSPLENSFTRIVPHVKAYFARGAQRRLEVHSETSMRPSSKWAWNVSIPPTSELEISSILIRPLPELVITNSFFIDFSMAVTTLAPLEGDVTLEGLYRYNGHEVTEGGGGSVQIISNQANLIDCGMPPPDSSTSSTIRSLPKFLRMRLSFQPKPVVTWIPAWERYFDLQLGLESPCPNWLGIRPSYTRPWYKLSMLSSNVDTYPDSASCGDIDGSHWKNRMISLPDDMVLYVKFSHVVKSANLAYQIHIVVDRANSAAVRQIRSMEEDCELPDDIEWVPDDS